MLDQLSEFELILKNVNEFLNAKKFKKAFIFMIPYTAKYSSHVEFLKIFGSVLKSINDNNGYIKVLMTISKLTESLTDRMNLLSALMVMNRRNEALDVALELNNSNLDNDSKEKVLKYLMRIYSVENDFEGLQEVSEQLALVIPFEKACHDQQLNFSRALLAASRSDLDLAISYIRQAVIDDPTFDLGWTTLALYHNKKGDLELAKANLEKALDLNPKQAFALKYTALWVDTKNSNEVDKVMDRINYYLKDSSFDEEINNCSIHILNVKGQTQMAKFEAEKMNYYLNSI